MQMTLHDVLLFNNSIKCYLSVNCICNVYAYIAFTLKNSLKERYLNGKDDIEADDW